MKVSVVMGSISDRDLSDRAIAMLKRFGVSVEVRVISAHRTPYAALNFAEEAERNGIDVIIAIAGKAAHLAGIVAGVTCLPVIGLPAKSSTMDGLDSLLSVVQMPKGVPVATVAIDGAENAALLAVQILAVKSPELREQLHAYKLELSDEVIKMNDMLYQ